MQIKNTATGAVLDSRSVSGFNGGQYVDITSNVTMHVQLTGGVNGVLSGIFFGD